MRVVCLGGAGAMASSCVYDLHKTSDFDEIVIADFDEGLANRVIGLMGSDKRFSFQKLDASDKEDIVRVLKGADYAIDGLPYKFIDNVMDAICELGISGVSMNFLDDDNSIAAYDEKLKKAGATFLQGNGGCATTCLMVMNEVAKLDEVDDINIHWGMWRPITHATHGLVDTLIGEYDPRVDERLYWENGKIIRNKEPFSLGMEFVFPEPIGKQELHIITHWEPVTLPHVPIIQEKRTKKIVVRGVWHYGWTRFVRTLLENGIFEAEPVEVNGVMVSPYEVIMAHIRREAKEEWEDPFELSESLGFNPHCVLSTDITGYKNGIGKRIVCHNQMPYPYFDGKAITSSMEYGSYVGLPCSVTLQLLHQGEIAAKGLTTIENSGFDPQRFLAELEKRKVTFTSEKNVKGQHNLAEKPRIPSTPTRAHRDWANLE